MIYLESCIETLKKNNDYNYVLTSPPDYAELGIDPKTNEWEDFLDSWISLLNPINNLVTVCTTDRKSDGKIYPKHTKVISVFEKNGWFLFRFICIPAFRSSERCLHVRYNTGYFFRGYRWRQHLGKKRGRKSAGPFFRSRCS